MVLVTCPSCEKSEKAKYERPATVTSKPCHRKGKYLRRLGSHLVVDHGPCALVVPLVDGLVGIDQLHLHLLNHCGTEAAVNSAVSAPLRLVESPFADNILTSHEKGMEFTSNEQFAGVSAFVEPTTRKRRKTKQRPILTAIGD